MDTQPIIKKNTKNKIRVEFERTNAWERFKLKFFSMFFLKKVVWWFFRLVLLIGISYVILFPFFAKISNSFKSLSDFADATVNYIPKYPTLDTYRAIIVDLEYFQALGNTLLLSVVSALLQTFTCCVIAYGFAKFKFKGSGALFAMVLLTMIIPHTNLRQAFKLFFGNFDIFGIFHFLYGKGMATPGMASINLLGSYWPMVFLSVTGLAFKNGLYIFMLRQFFRGVPDELEESAYIDGYGPFQTFIKIILPLSVPMLITVFLFSFSWQFTDDFYTNLFFSGVGTKEPLYLLSTLSTKIPVSLSEFTGSEGVGALFSAAISSTNGLLIMIPLIIVFLFCQKYLVQGIERSGIVG